LSPIIEMKLVRTLLVAHAGIAGRARRDSVPGNALFS
jgi:hypothetical protein